MEGFPTNVQLPLRPVPPFDFDLSAQIFSGGDRQVQKYEKGEYWQVIRINGRLILAVIRSLGTVDKPKLLVDLKTTERISDNDRRKAEEIIVSLFNLKLYLKSFYNRAKDDKVLFSLIQKLTGLRSPTTPTVFEGLISSIIEQQISLNVAHTLETRIVKTFGDALQVDTKVYFAFPTPQKLASATTEELRECGLSLRKAEYILNVAGLIAHQKLNLDDFQNCENADEIIRELDRIRGIGVWTAELTMVRGMHKFDVMPTDDLGLRRCISHYYRNDQKIGSTEARDIAEKWGKWKGLACFYLIMAERLGIIA